MTVTGPNVEIVLNPAEMQAMLRGPSGSVMRHLIVVGERVKIEAIRTAPRVTGNLAQHIVKRISRNGNEPAVLVGIENVPYAIWVVQGANEHDINARRAPLLVFYWEREGRVVGFPKVHHPGNKPNRFLQRAVDTVANQGGTT